MQVAIIGAGNVAKALGSSFKRAGQHVVIADRTPEKARDLASTLGAESAGSFSEAARSADVVLLAVTFAGGAESVSRAIADDVAGKIVIDVTNPLGERGLLTEGGPSGGERIQGWLGSAKVVKAFNTIFGSKLANPVADGQPVDAFIAGDDEGARLTVAGLAAEMGFRPVDCGPLARARELESLAFLGITLQATKNGTWDSAWKLIAAPPAAVTASEAAGQTSR